MLWLLPFHRNLLKNIPTFLGRIWRDGKWREFFQRFISSTSIHSLSGWFSSIMKDWFRIEWETNDTTIKRGKDLLLFHTAIRITRKGKTDMFEQETERAVMGSLLKFVHWFPSLRRTRGFFVLSRWFVYSTSLRMGTMRGFICAMYTIAHLPKYAMI